MLRGRSCHIKITRINVELNKLPVRLNYVLILVSREKNCFSVLVVVLFIVIHVCSFR